MHGNCCERTAEWKDMELSENCRAYQAGCSATVAEEQGHSGGNCDKAEGNTQSPSERGGDTKVCKTWKEGVAKVQDADVASEKSNSERTWMESENIQHEQLSDLL